MKIIVNAASIFKGGAEQVVHSFINECKGIPGNEYHILLCDNIYQNLDVPTFGENFHFHRLEKRPGTSLLTLFKSLSSFDKLEKEIQPDAVISTGGHGYWNPEAPLITAFNIPHHLYPESPYFRKVPAKRRLYWKLKRQFDLYFYRNSDAIIVQTDDVKKRVENLLPNIPVKTVSNTINGVFLDPEKFERKIFTNRENEFRLLTVSSSYPHKNLDIIPKVIKQLRQAGENDVKFILTLPEESYEKLVDEQSRDQIINVGPVPIEECPALYDEADVMFLPTLLECFSASYVEAMAMEKPILTSDLGFAHGICGDAALYFDPMDQEDIAASIIKLRMNIELKDRIVNEGTKRLQKIPSPRERAEAFLAVAQSLVESKRNVRNSRI